MELLKRVENREYPADYLLSRIRGKRASLISDWGSLIHSEAPLEYLSSSRYRGFLTEKSPEGLWRELSKEYRWVYLRMGKEFFRIFSPFFLYCELRTIFTSMHHISGRKAGKSGGALSESLLSDEIKKILGEGEDITATLREVEKHFATLSKTFEGVANIFDHGGLRDFERELTIRYLVATVRSGPHPLMKDFFVRIIDTRNIISLYKFLRLKPKTAPVFIPEGSISEPGFAGTVKRGDLTEVYGLAGIKDNGLQNSNIESVLYRNISIFLRKAGRDPLGIGPILDYLWRCEREVINLGILSYGREIDRDAITAELVY